MLTGGRFTLTANVSLLFQNLPYPERFAAAAELGFSHVETWWPFDSSVPDAEDIQGFLGTLRASGLELTGLNAFAGDMAGGERGVACLPDRQDEFVASLAVLREIAQATGCSAFNLLYGNKSSSFSADDQATSAARAFAGAAEMVADLGGMVLLEPLGRDASPNYGVHGLDQALAFLDGPVSNVGAANTGLLFDTFHLASNGVDLVEAVHEFAPHIGHVQVADVPGRGAPGTGSLDFDGIFGALHSVGYDGLVGCEYVAPDPGPEVVTWAGVQTGHRE